MPSNECVILHFKALVPLTPAIQQLTDNAVHLEGDPLRAVERHRTKGHDRGPERLELGGAGYNNPNTVESVAADGNLYQRHNDGRIWHYIGPPLTGWQELDTHPATVGITAADGNRWKQVARSKEGGGYALGTHRQRWH